MATPPPTPNLTNLLQQLLENQQTLQENQQSFQTELNQLRRWISPLGLQALGFETQTQGAAFGSTSVKLEIPRFDGKEALRWIFKIKQFFHSHRTPEAQCLHISSFYMEGETLTWFQWTHSNGILHSWQVFLHALGVRLPFPSMTIRKGALFKLCQTTTVKEYQSTFEELENRTVSLSHEFYISCFISGVKPEILREVQVFQPISLSHANSLVKLQKEKSNDKLPFHRRP